MLTLALAAPGPEFTDFEVTRDHWKLAREAGARITTHVGVGSYGQDAKVQEFGEAGLLGPDTTYIHCTTLNDTEIQMIVDTGGTVSLASPVEMMMGHGMPPIQKFLDRGLASEPERGRRDERARRHVQPDAFGAGAPAGVGDGVGQGAALHEGDPGVRDDRGRQGATGSTRRWGP